MTTYYRYNDLTRVLTAEKNYIVTADGATIVNPSTEQYATLRDAYPKGDDAPKPTPPEGKLVEPDGWEVRGGAWHCRWRYVDAPLPTLDEYDSAMEDHLYQERSARGYTTREPDAYLSSANPRWAQDAHDWVAHRDAVMAYALTLINGVQSGTIAQPTLAEFRANLPQISWSYQEDS